MRTNARPGYLLSTLSLALVLAGCADDSVPSLGRTSSALEVPSDTVVGSVAVGTLPGRLGVSRTGAATYSVPIQVPAGRNGMQPDLSLTYDSRVGNGLLGVGWTISGISSITRCASSEAYGGRRMAIGFHSLDQFCLDGAPLVAVDGGDYGADGTEYRTVPDRFARIVSEGDLDGAPARFVVQYRDGRIATFSSRFEAGRVFSHELDGHLSVTEAQGIWGWGLDRVADRYGNAMTVEWARFINPADAFAHEHMPSVIRYSFSGPDGKGQARREVRFEYEESARPDLIDHFVAGFHHHTARRLEGITTHAPDEEGVTRLVHRYALAYRSDTTTERTLLTSIRQCDAEYVCLPATSFLWEEGTNDIAADVVISDVDPGARLHVADLNADGMDDLVFETTRGAWNYALSTGSGYTAPQRVFSGHERVVALVDSDLDGRVEVLDGDSHRAGGKYEFDGSKFVETQSLALFSDPPKIGDLDGNGAPDLLRAPGEGLWWHSNTHGELFGTAEFITVSDGDPEYAERAHVIRLFNDGAQQVLYDGGDRYAFVGFGGGVPYTSTTNVETGWTAHVFMDINGDGLDDVLNEWRGEYRINLGYGFGPWQPAIRSGTWRLPAQLVPSEYREYQLDNGSRVVDFNNDGRMDLARSWDNGGDLCLSRGDHFDCSSYSLFQTARPEEVLSYQYQFLDADGNLSPDLAIVHGGSLRVYYRDTGPGDRIWRVIDGNQATHDIHYTTTANPDVYDAGPGCSHPQRCDLRRVPLVERLVVDAGDGVRDLHYQYHDARSDVRGQGFLGFARVRVTDPTRQRVEERRYAVDPPVNGRYTRLGMLEEHSVLYELGGGRRRVEHTDFENLAWESAGGSFYARPTAVDRSLYEWTDAVVSEPLTMDRPLPDLITGHAPFHRSEIDRTYDDFGTLESDAKRVIGGSTTSTSRTIENRPDEWILGLVRHVRRTSTIASGATSTYEMSFEFDDQGGEKLRTLMPGRPDLAVTRETHRESDGLVKTRIERGSSGAPRTTTVEYDAERVTVASITNPAGHVMQYAYHPGLGVLAARMDANGNPYRYRYDGFGRLRQAIAPDGRVETIRHRTSTLGSYRVDRESSRGQSSFVELDELGRVIRRGQLIDGRWSHVDTSYADDGHVGSRSNPYFAGDAASQTRWTRDGMGRVLRIDFADGTHVERAHDPERTHFFDQMGRYGYFDFDEDRRLHRSVSQIDGRELVTTFEYAPFGRLDRIIDADGNVVTDLDWDERGRRTRSHNADAGTTTFTYDAFGDLLTETNALGELTTWTRDALGRVTRIDDAGGTTHFAWDSARTPSGDLVLGELAGAESPDGVTSEFAYDSLGRLTSKRISVAGRTMELRREFDSVGRVDRLHYPGGAAGAFAVDLDHAPAGGQLRSITHLGYSIWRASDHDPHGRVALETLGNGVQRERLFDPQTGRVERIESFVWELVGSSGWTKRHLQDLRYGYWANGHTRSVRDEVDDRDELFLMDHLNRVDTWKVVRSGATESHGYGYDDIGNMLSHSTSVGTTTFGHAGAGAGPHVVSSADGVALDHDAAGRRVRDGSTTIDYTPFNLPSLIVDTTGSTSFDYDAFAVRARRSRGADVSEYLDGFYERRVREGKVSHHFYVRAGGRVVAEVIDSAGARDVRYLHPDRLGSVALITRSDGSVHERRRFSPFGELVSGSSPTGPALTAGFTGHEGDWGEGLINMRGRIYDPRTSRFLTPDPYVAAPFFGQAHNRYAYVMNSPATFTDPTGMVPEPGEQVTPQDHDFDGGDQESIDGVCPDCEFEGMSVHGSPDAAPGQDGPTLVAGDPGGYGFDDGYAAGSYDESGYDTAPGTLAHPGEPGGAQGGVPQDPRVAQAPTLQEQQAGLSDPTLHAEGDAPILASQLHWPLETDQLLYPDGTVTPLDSPEFAVGVSVQGSVVIGAGIQGNLSFRCTSGDGCGFSGEGGLAYGLDVSAGANVHAAVGRGQWGGEGASMSPGIGLGPSVGAFSTDSGRSGWAGVSVGAGVGITVGTVSGD